MRLRCPKGAPFAFAVFFAALSSHAAEAEKEKPRSPFSLRPEVEVPVLLSAAAVWALPWAFEDELAPGRCAPCDPSDVNAFDRTAIGFDNRGARVASNVGAFGVPALAGIASLFDAARFGRGAALEDLVLVAESVAISGAVNQVVKQGFRRPRPYMYDAELAEESGTAWKNYLSFYSGHTSTAFAAATSFATIFALRRPDDPWRFAVWGAGLAASTMVGACRVLAGRHFWTDVIAGAVAGSAVGVLVPRMHLRRRSARGEGVSARIVAGPGSAAVFVWF